jgi:hypothetical protein
MSFPVMNAHVSSSQVFDIDDNGATTMPSLATVQQYPIFAAPGVVDVSGMEFHIAIHRGTATATVVAQAMASAASTVSIVYGDGGTTATGDAGANIMVGGAQFSNGAVDGGWGAHQAVKAAGTTTTDLDADDWINMQAIENATGLLGAVQAGAAFIYGKPGAIN